VYPSAVEQIRDRLATARAQADGVLVRAAADARKIETEADGELRDVAEQRLAEIEEVRRTIVEQSRAVEGAYARLVESMAETAMELLTISREADFSPPSWSGGIPWVVELRLSETREVTVRLPIRGPGADLGG
jgi:hypothetical protein